MNKKIGNYEFSPDESLGSGTFATVYRGKHSKTGKIVAVKAIDMRRVSQTPHEDKYIESEIQIMLSLRHPNIVQLEDVIRSETMLYMVLEYCGGGDFASYIRQKKKLGEKQAQYFMKHLSLGLQCLHQKGVAHRDLKPHNLLLSDKSETPTLKIADFGFARMMSSVQLATTICGSPLYMAPEVLSCQRYTDKADLWSVGAVFYEMLSGSPPFRARSPVELNELIHRVANVKLPPDIQNQVSESCSKLITALLTVNTDNRISWESFLADPWLSLTSPDHSQLSSQSNQTSTSTSTISSSQLKQQQITQNIQSNNRTTPKSPQLPRDIVSPELSPQSPTQQPQILSTVNLDTSATSSESPASEFERECCVLASGNNTQQQQQKQQQQQPISTPFSRTSNQQQIIIPPQVSVSPATTPNGGFISPPPQLPPAERLAEELKGWSKMATVIMELADLKKDAGYTVEGFALYVHAISVLHNAILTANRRVVSDNILIHGPPVDPRLQDSMASLNKNLTDCLRISEDLKRNLAPHLTTVLPEKLVYDQAMLLSREGALQEKTGFREKAHKNYEDALYLLDSITPTIPNDQDKSIIFKYSSLLRIRLAVVSKP